MENPYHIADVKPHYLDRGAARIIVFDIFNIIAASQSLASQFESAEPGEDILSLSTFRLHHEIAERRLSQLLLQLAVFVRTFDDILSTGENADSYAKHAERTQGENLIGAMEGADDFGLRDACNKIIHATDFRPVYDRVERGELDDSPESAWHLTGEIELTGSLGKRSWSATLWTQDFLEVVLDRLAFDPPAQ